MSLFPALALGSLALGVGYGVYKRRTRTQVLGNLVGQRVRLSYYDHNVRFEAILPLLGTVVSRHRTADVDDWFLLRLDEPFDYDGIDRSHVLIRSKWMGSVIGREEHVAVFVLLIPDMGLLSQREIKVEQFEHVVCGFADVVRDA